jgi:hypothetical protein
VGGDDLFAAPHPRPCWQAESNQAGRRSRIYELHVKRATFESKVNTLDKVNIG